MLTCCSCLIARNLLSGLKTCIEVSSYMYDDGSAMLHRSAVVPSSFLEDNGRGDADYTVSITVFFFFAFSCVLFSKAGSQTRCFQHR